MSNVLTEDEQFFYDHAGWSYDPQTETSEQGRVRCARELAIAEQFAKARGLVVDTSTDPDGPMDDDAGSVEGCESGEYVCLIVTLHDEDGSVLEALGNVIVQSESDPYVRVVGAELADQFYDRIKPRVGQPFTFSAHQYVNVPECTIVPTYVRVSELPRPDGSCLTANLADPTKFAPAGWYVESEAGRDFISFADAKVGA